MVTFKGKEYCFEFACDFPTVLCNNNYEWIKEKLFRDLATMDTRTKRYIILLLAGEIVNKNKNNIQMVCLPRGLSFWTGPS
jgi:hypothetical protein